MSLPPIPKRKGMVAHSAAFVDGEWRNVLYRPEHEAQAPVEPPRPARGLVATAQGELPL